MLVITRTPAESIVIDATGQGGLWVGDHLIHIKILAVNGKQVRVGIDAPPEIKIHREEIARDIAENGLRMAADGGAL